MPRKKPGTRPDQGSTTAVDEEIQREFAYAMSNDSSSSPEYGASPTPGAFAEYTRSLEGQPVQSPRGDSPVEDEGQPVQFPPVEEEGGIGEEIARGLERMLGPQAEIYPAKTTKEDVANDATTADDQATGLKAARKNAKVVMPGGFSDESSNHSDNPREKPPVTNDADIQESERAVLDMIDVMVASPGLHMNHEPVPVQAQRVVVIGPKEPPRVVVIGPKEPPPDVAVTRPRAEPEPHAVPLVRPEPVPEVEAVPEVEQPAAEIVRAYPAGWNVNTRNTRHMCPAWNTLMWHSRYHGIRVESEGGKEKFENSEWYWCSFPEEDLKNLPQKPVAAADRMFPLLMSPPYMNAELGTDMDLFHRLAYRDSADCRTLLPTNKEVYVLEVLKVISAYGQGGVYGGMRFQMLSKDANKTAKWIKKTTLASKIILLMQLSQVVPPGWRVCLPGLNRMQEGEATRVGTKFPTRMWSGLCAAIYALLMHTRYISNVPVGGRSGLPYTIGMFRHLMDLRAGNVSSLHLNRAVWYCGCMSLRFCAPADIINKRLFPAALLDGTNTDGTDAVIQLVNDGLKKSSSERHFVTWARNFLAFIWYLTACPRNLVRAEVNVKDPITGTSEATAYLLIPPKTSGVHHQFVSLPMTAKRTNNLKHILTVTATNVGGRNYATGPPRSPPQEVEFEEQVRDALNQVTHVTYQADLARYNIRQVDRKTEGIREIRALDRISVATSTLEDSIRLTAATEPIHYAAVGFAAVLAATIGSARNEMFRDQAAVRQWTCTLRLLYGQLSAVPPRPRMEIFYEVLGQLGVDVEMSRTQTVAEAALQPVRIRYRENHETKYLAARTNKHYLHENLEHMDILWSALQLRIREMIPWNWLVEPTERIVSGNGRSERSQYFRPADDRFPRDIIHRIGDKFWNKKKEGSWRGKIRTKNPGEQFDLAGARAGPIRDILGTYICADDHIFTDGTTWTYLCRFAQPMAALQATVERALVLDSFEQMARHDPPMYAVPQLPLWFEDIEATMAKTAHLFLTTESSVKDLPASEWAFPQVQVEVIIAASEWLKTNSVVNDDLHLIYENPRSANLDASITIPVTMVFMAVLQVWSHSSATTPARYALSDAEITVHSKTKQNWPGIQKSHGVWMDGAFSKLFTTWSALTKKNITADVELTERLPDSDRVTYEAWKNGYAPTIYERCNKLMLAIQSYDSYMHKMPQPAKRAPRKPLTIAPEDDGDEIGGGDLIFTARARKEGEVGRVTLHFGSA